MITITHKQARTLRAVFRRIGDVRCLRAAAVVFSASQGGLRVQCRASAVAVECCIPGDFPAATFGIPLGSLDDFEGSTSAEVSLDDDGAGSVSATWTDAGIPQKRTYKAVELATPPLLAAPTDAVQVGDFPVFEELAEVCRSAAKDSTRYALNCLQLRGERGQAVATDGREMLIVNGFAFPWKNDVLVPRTKLFDSKEFRGDEPVLVARTEDHVVFIQGNWRIWLPIDKTSRFPDIDRVVPTAATSPTRVSLAAADAEFLVRTISRLPGGADDNAPVTIHCNGHVAVRAKAEDSTSVAELSLDGSTVHGDEVLVLTNRDLLARAAALGIREIRFYGADSPALCTSERRQFVWKPLTGEAIPPNENAIRIHSGGPPEAAPSPQPEERKSKPMPQAAKDEKRAERPAPAAEVAPGPSTDTVDAANEAPVDPIEAAEALKGVLRDALIQTGRLAAALRKQQKTAKLVKSTLLSLRQLGEVG